MRLVSGDMRVATIIIVLSALLGCGKSPERLLGADVIVLEGATLIDGTGSAPRRNAVIVLRGGRIIRVGGEGEFVYPPGSTTIDLTGEWIIPGLIDTHAHMPSPQDQEGVLSTLLAFGITTVRNPAAEPEEGVELRDRIARGDVPGPRLRTAGNLIDAPGGIFSGASWVTEVATEQEVRGEVRRQVAEGVDLIKVYRSVPPPLVKAAIDEAHALGRPVLGHLGATTWREAATFGIDGLAHFGIFGTPWELAPEEDRATIKQSCDGRGDGEGLRILGTMVPADGQEAAAWAHLLAAQHVTVEPNLVLLQAVFWGDDRSVLQALEPAYAPASWRDGTWFDAVPHPYLGPHTEQWKEEAQATYPLFERLVRLLERSGVVLTVGTDLMNPWMTPGVAYHRELELLVRAGLSPNEVLVAATRNGAVALGLEREVGTIEEGKAADLVVLRSDPTVSIRNTRAIERVFLGGAEHVPARLAGSR